MRVLLTGGQGYLGRVVGPWLSAAGHRVTVVDSGFFSGGRTDRDPRLDVRDMTNADLAEHECVVHLAGLSNDACADLNPRAAIELNHLAAAWMAATARRAGLRGIVFASSCSVYGRAGASCREDGMTAPLTRYARTKLAAETEVLAQRTARFSPVVLRFGTAYGLSPSLRTDLVVNRMTASAVFTGTVVVEGDGCQRRPMVHVREVARAIEGVIELLPTVGGEIINVAGERGNVQISEIAERVAASVAGARITVRPAAADRRDYDVDGSKLRGLGIRLEEDIASAVDEMVPVLARRFDSLDSALGAPQNRARAIATLIDRGELDTRLRWIHAPTGSTTRSAFR